MFTIITRNMKVVRDRTDVMNVAPSMEQIHFRFSDGVEMSVPYKITPQISAALNLIMTAPQDRNITVDLTNPTYPVSFS